MSSNGKAKATEDDDLDLDDLDDVLAQFHPTPPPPHPKPQPKPKAAPPPPPGPAAPPPPPTSAPEPAPDDPISEDFARQLAAEMEKMMLELGGGAPSSSSSGAAADPAEDAGDDAFQKTIRQAMEKLQESDDTLKADTRGGQDSLEELLASLKLGEGEGEGGDANLESMLETMMSQLMSKEILYEPLKELDTKYPEYLAENAPTLPPADLARYTAQKGLVTQIVTLFEDPSYSDENPEKSTEVLRLMNEMQSHGSPPGEIMGAMPPGFDLGADGLPNIPEGCVIA